MKAYKIQVDPYDIENVSLDEKGEELKNKKILYPKFELPRILCNPNLGATTDGKKGKPSQEFDLMEIGPISQKIEQAKDIFVTVNGNELDILKKRLKIISSFFGYNHYEMFRRILEAQPVDMIEKSGKGS